MSLAVKAVGVRKSFGGHEVLKGLDLEVAYGEVLCILGPSGSGKSTFLRCINHLEIPNAGYVWVDGAIMGYELRSGVLQELPVRRLRAQQSQLGMVFQHFNLFAHRTVLGNVIEGPMVVRGLRRAEAEKRAMELLDQVGMAGRASSYPAQLSGGQKQRVAIARAFANPPDLVICDEITAALDVSVQATIIELLLELRRRYGTAYLFITHDLNLIRQIAHRVAVMYRGDVVEVLSGDNMMALAQHPYTRALLDAVHIPDLSKSVA